MNMQERFTPAGNDSPLDATSTAVRELGKTAADGARQLSQTASREAEHVGNSARQWWAHNRDDARQVAQQARERAIALGESTQDYVREQPLKALLAAAVLGAVLTGLSMLATRRSH